MTPPSIALVLLAGFAVAGCQPTMMDRPSTLTRLRAAIDEEVAGPVVLEDHNQLVENIVMTGVFEGMFESELEAALGHGADCGIRDLCREHGFRPTDWTYEVGHAPGDPSLPAGPTLVIGFDRTGRVERTYYVARRGTTTAH